MKKTIIIIIMIVFICIEMLSFNAEFINLPFPDDIISSDYSNVYIAINRGVYGTLIGNYSFGLLNNYGLQSRYHDTNNDYPISYLDYHYQQVQYLSKTYISDKTFEYVYLSKVNLGGIFYSILDTHIDKTASVSQDFKLYLYHFISSISAILLLLFIGYWCYKEFGLISSLFVYISLIGSIFLAPYGSGLCNSAFSIFLAFTVSLFILNFEDNNNKKVNGLLEFLIIFIVIAIKAMMGYEMMPSVMVSATVMYFYYAVSRKWNIKYFAKRFIRVSSAAVSGLVFTICMHFIQLKLYFKNTADGLRFLLESFGKRSWADTDSYTEIIGESLNATFSEVIRKYYNISLTHGFIFKLNLKQFLFTALFIIVTALILYYIIRISRQNAKDSVKIISSKMILALVIIFIGAAGALPSMIVLKITKKYLLVMASILVIIAVIIYIMIRRQTKNSKNNIIISSNKIAVFSSIIFIGAAGALSILLLRSAFILSIITIVSITIVVALCYMIKKQSNVDENEINTIYNKILGLVVAAVVGLIGALSTLIVFKAHSYIHGTFTIIAFCLPFSILIFALTGFLFELMLTKSRLRLSYINNKQYNRGKNNVSIK